MIDIVLNSPYLRQQKSSKEILFTPYSLSGSHRFVALFQQPWSPREIQDSTKRPQRPQYSFSCISNMSFFRSPSAVTGPRNSQATSRPVSRVPPKSPNPTVSPLNFDTLRTPTVHSSSLLASTASSRAKSISPINSSAPSPSPSTAPRDRKFSFCSVDPNDPDGTVHRFHRLLNKPHTSKIYRSKADIEDALKRLRRYILAEGIPADLVSDSQNQKLVFWENLMMLFVIRTLPFARGFGRSSCKWIRSILLRTFVTCAKVLVQCVRRFETIHSGKSSLCYLFHVPL